MFEYTNTLLLHDLTKDSRGNSTQLNHMEIHIPRFSNLIDYALHILRPFCESVLKKAPISWFEGEDLTLSGSPFPWSIATWNAIGSYGLGKQSSRRSAFSSLGMVRGSRTLNAEMLMRKPFHA